MTSKSAAALTSLTPARPGQASLVGEHDELGASQWTGRLAAAHLSGKLQAELTAPETVIQLPVADAVELTELLQFIMTGSPPATTSCASHSPGSSDTPPTT